MLNPLSFEREIAILTPNFDITTLDNSSTNRRTNLAITCLLDFFKDDPDTVMPGIYVVKVRENLIKGCTYNLFFRAFDPV